MPIPKGSMAVMARRLEPPAALDFFPTPPWATRALCEHVLPGMIGPSPWRQSVLEPAAGERHMADVLEEYFSEVDAWDVFDYRGGDDVASFVGTGPDVLHVDHDSFNWIITNPPFNLALDFALRGLDLAVTGVALMVRTAWLEGSERYERLFGPHPPSLIAQFVERVR